MLDLTPAPREGIGPRGGGTSLSCDQTAIRPHEDALSRHGQERCAGTDVVCVEQLVDEPQACARERIATSEVRVAAPKPSKTRREIVIQTHLPVPKNHQRRFAAICGYERRLIRPSLAYRVGCLQLLKGPEAGLATPTQHCSSHAP